MPSRLQLRRGELRVGARYSNRGIAAAAAGPGLCHELIHRRAQGLFIRSFGETAESSSTGGTDTGNGAAAGSSTGGTATSGTGTATGAGTGTGTTTGGCGSATLTVSPNLIDFGYVSPGSLAIRCTMVSNPCGASISITGVADFATGDGVFAVAATDDFPIAVGGGEHAQVCFSFTPPITQDYTGQATLLTSDGANPVVQLTGWGGGPEISCTPLTLAFGSVPIGDASVLSVTCYNTGSAAPGVLPPLLIGPLDAGGGVFSAAFDTEINDASRLQPPETLLAKSGNGALAAAAGRRSLDRESASAASSVRDAGALLIRAAVPGATLVVREAGLAVQLAAGRVADAVRVASHAGPTGAAALIGIAFVGGSDASAGAVVAGSAATRRPAINGAAGGPGRAAARGPAIDG